MTMEQSPHIAVVTNLSPNHLDYRRTMEEYVRAKKNIFLHQGPEDRLILNYDNAPTQALAREAVCPVTFFSRQERLEEGLPPGWAIWLTNDQGSREVLLLELVRTPATATWKTIWPPSPRWTAWSLSRCVRAVARRFPGSGARMSSSGGLEKRCAGTTTPSAPAPAAPPPPGVLDRKVVLIAGGYDKGIPFTQLGMEIMETG